MQEKQTLINNLKINYKIFGEGNIPIILLHGWGIDSDKYAETANQLSLKTNDYGLQTKIIIPDLLGFGKSDDPPQVWIVDDYVELVKDFIETVIKNTPSNSPYKGEKNMYSSSCEGGGMGYKESEKYSNKIILIGHSFGGRIAIKFSAKYPEKVKCLILTGAAGIKHPFTIKKKIFYAAAKTGKIFFSLPIINRLETLAQKLLYKAAREKDYYKAQGIMKETFKKVIAEDLTPYLEKIITPTLLVWGKNDHSTPIEDAYIMKEKIKKSELVIIENANHGLPYKNAEEFSKITSDFIKK